MAGYSGTPLWKKLGLKPGGSLALLNAPRGWAVPDLPSEVGAAKRTPQSLHSHEQSEVAVAFFKTLARMQEQLPKLADGIFPDGALWIAWPRRAAGHESDIRESDIRDAALPLGLIDVKVAAIDEDWSGLRLVWRTERRAASGI